MKQLHQSMAAGIGKTGEIFEILLSGCEADRVAVKFWVWLVQNVSLDDSAAMRSVHEWCEMN